MSDLKQLKFYIPSSLYLLADVTHTSDRMGSAANQKTIQSLIHNNRCVTSAIRINCSGLGRNLRHLVNTVYDLSSKGIGFKVLTGQGTQIDTTILQGELVFGIFSALAEFERDLISERTKAGLASARARGRTGEPSFKMTAAKVHLAAVSIQHPETKISNLYKELGVTRQTSH